MFLWASFPVRRMHPEFSPTITTCKRSCSVQKIIYYVTCKYQPSQSHTLHKHLHNVQSTEGPHKRNMSSHSLMYWQLEFRDIKELLPHLAAGEVCVGGLQSSTASLWCWLGGSQGPNLWQSSVWGYTVFGDHRLQYQRLRLIRFRQLFRPRMTGL